MRYRHFGTTADVGVTSYGESLKEAFENQAAGMFSIMVDLRGVREKLSFDIEAQASDLEGLLIAWLDELLFVSETKRVFLKRFEVVSIVETKLRAKAYGEEINPARHVLKTDVKAVTYHMLEVRREPGCVTTRVVYDI